MSLMDRIGNFTPSSGEQGVWLFFKNSDGSFGPLPLEFLFKLERIIPPLSNDNPHKSFILSGKAELWTAGYTPEQIADREQHYGIPEGRPVQKQFFPVGTMQWSQMANILGIEVPSMITFEWKQQVAEAINAHALGGIFHYRYNGKKKSNTGTTFHQLFIKRVT